MSASSGCSISAVILPAMLFKWIARSLRHSVDFPQCGTHQQDRSPVLSVCLIHGGTPQAPGLCAWCGPEGPDDLDDLRDLFWAFRCGVYGTLRAVHDDLFRLLRRLPLRCEDCVPAALCPFALPAIIGEFRRERALLIPLRLDAPAQLHQLRLAPGEGERLAAAPRQGPTLCGRRLETAGGFRRAGIEGRCGGP